MPNYIDRVTKAIHDLKQGKIIILTDHPKREDEGDLVFPAETITPEIMNFFIRHTSGIVCLPLLAAQLKKLNLSYMVPPYENSSARGTPFTISIDAANHISTGVSAADRVQTIQIAVSDYASPNDIVKPGHIFPLWAKENGVLGRPGHTEGSIDIVRLAGFKPAAVLCELMNPDGTMMRGKQLIEFAEQHQLTILSIDDIISYRLTHDDLIAEQVTADLPMDPYGAFKISVIKEKITGHEHIVLAKEKSKDNDAPTLVRIHSSCITGDLFCSKRCDCHQQLHYSLQRISEEGGMLFYLNQEGRGIGLFNKIKAYLLQEQGLDTIEANEQLGLPVDSRQYYIVANYLRNHGVQQIRLLTNNPNKVADLEKYGNFSVEQEALPVFCNEHNKKYLQTKKDKFSHTIQFPTV